MSTIRVIYHLVRADFYERVRRYSFLVMLALAVFLGYQTAIDNISLGLGQYRGEYNSAWVGAMMSLLASFFIGWFGFYLVKGSVARDRETGVGQIIAATPLTRPSYMIGKWLSNFSILMAMVVVLVFAGIGIQILRGESAQINLLSFLSPFLFLAMPLMALVAALAVLFETIPFLRSGFGNIVYFFAFIMAMGLFIEMMDAKFIAFEPTGIAILADDMGKAVLVIDPAYDGDFTLGSNETKTSKTFIWTGLHWTTDLVFARFTLIGLAVLVSLLAALFFDRFDPSRSKPQRKKSAAPPTTVKFDSAPRILSTPHLTPLRAGGNSFNFFRVLLVELTLLVKGQRWWWYAIAAGLIIAGLVNDAKITREILLPLVWIWHILLLSSLGNRESYHNVHQMTFSSAFPLGRQFPAQWLAGFLVTLIMGSGAVLNFTINGDGTAMLGLLAGAFFIPSLAIALGTWSGTSKTFEVVYLTLWYLGPINRIPPVDFTNASGEANPMFFIISALVLIAIAALGRARQIRT